MSKLVCLLLLLLLLSLSVCADFINGGFENPTCPGGTNGTTCGWSYTGTANCYVTVPSDNYFGSPQSARIYGDPGNTFCEICQQVSANTNQALIFSSSVPNSSANRMISYGTQYAAETEYGTNINFTNGCVNIPVAGTYWYCFKTKQNTEWRIDDVQIIDGSCNVTNLSGVPVSINSTNLTNNSIINLTGTFNFSAEFWNGTYNNYNVTFYSNLNGTENVACAYTGLSDRINKTCAINLSNYSGLFSIRIYAKDILGNVSNTYYLYSTLNQGKLFCPDSYGDVWMCLPNITNCLSKRLFVECNRSTEYCDVNSSFCLPLNSSYPYTYTVEDAGPETRVFKQPGDYVTIVFYSNQTQTVNYSTNLVLESGPCQSGNANLVIGETRCKYSIPSSATTALFKSGIRQANLHLTTNPDTIYVTDRNATYQRYPDNPSRVQQLLTQIYSKADPREATIYYLDDYLTGRPWGSYQSYNESPSSQDTFPNDYVISTSDFVTHKCGKCKNVVIVGDDYVVPSQRISTAYSSGWFIWNNENFKKIYSDSSYIPTTSAAFSGLDSIFDNEKVVLVIPDYHSGIDSSIATLKQVLVDKYHNSNGHLTNVDDLTVFTSSEVFCNSYEDLGKSTVILVGDQNNNRGVSCLAYVKGYEDTISVERNVWGSDKFVVVLSSNDSTALDAFTGIVQESLFSRQFPDKISLLKISVNAIGNYTLPYSDANGYVYSSAVGLCGHFADSISHNGTDSGLGAWCVTASDVIFMLPTPDTVLINPTRVSLKDQLEFNLGFFAGSTLEEYYNSPAYHVGWLLSGFIVIGDFRDVLYYKFWVRDQDAAAMSAIGIIPLGGDAVKAEKLIHTKTVVKEFLEKTPDDVVSAGRMTAKHPYWDNVPSAVNEILSVISGSEKRIKYLDEVYDGAATALKNKGVTEERIIQLANKENPINLARHNQVIDMLLAAKNGNPQRSIQGADDIAEVLGDELIRLKYPANKGFTVKYNLKLWLDGIEQRQIDTVVLDSDSRVIAVIQTKSKNSLSAFEAAQKQIRKDKDIISYRMFDEVTLGDGTPITPDKLNANNIKDYITVGPNDAPYEYTDKLLDTEDEITELSNSLDLI